VRILTSTGAPVLSNELNEQHLGISYSIRLTRFIDRENYIG